MLPWERRAKKREFPALKFNLQDITALLGGERRDRAAV